MPDLDTTTARLHLFADATRIRLLCLLRDTELTVAELTRIVELPQSRVSTHLGKLRDGGLLRDRKAGAATYYALNEKAFEQAVGALWTSLHAQLDDDLLERDRQRCEVVLEARERAAAWPDSVAGQMEHHYSPGRTWEAMARGFVGLLRLGDVLDVGSGDGAIAHLLAPRARSVTCIDRSDRVIEAARSRLSRFPNVRFAVADMHTMPLADAAFDVVLLFNVLTFAPSPAEVLAEAYRVVRPGGDIAVATLHVHKHMDVAAAYDHVHPGYSPRRLRQLLEQGGFVVDSCEVTSRERRKPYFEVLSAFARKPALAAAS